MKTAFVSLVALLSLVACSDGSPSEPAGGSPTVVPAGISDPAWAAISNSCAADSPVRALSAAQRVGLPPYSHGSMPTSDDSWAELARTAPGGIGGVFLEAGVPIMYLTDVSKRDGAVTAFKASGLAGPGIDWNATVARAGRWNFALLADWYRYLSPQLMGNLAYSADIQEARNRLEYSVRSEADRAATEAKLKQLDVPCFLVAIKVGSGPVSTDYGE